jgi:hypothetical protein
MVTPVVEHCGEFDIGLAGSSGARITTGFIITIPFNVTSSLIHLVPPPLALIKYIRKVTAPTLVKLSGESKAVAV